MGKEYALYSMHTTVSGYLALTILYKHSIFIQPLGADAASGSRCQGNGTFACSQQSKQSYKQTEAVAAVDTYTLREVLKGLREGIKKERLDVERQSPLPDV